jgi:excisionase family DNA binding protein
VAVDGDDWITVPTAAQFLGLQLHTVYRLIENGEFGAVDTYGIRMSGRPRRRRSFRLTRREVDDYIERARIKPGELRHLVPPTARQHLPTRSPSEWAQGGRR